MIRYAYPFEDSPLGAALLRASLAQPAPSVTPAAPEAKPEPTPREPGQRRPGRAVPEQRHAVA
jgi:hypothetical protein